MPSQAQILNTILSAGLQMANLVNANYAQISVGNGLVKWGKVRQLNRGIIALNNKYSIGDYTSITTQKLYDCLNGSIGLGVNPTLDPNFQSQGIVISVTGGASVGVQTLTKNQSNLVEDGTGSGNWYLPFTDSAGNAIPSTLVPVSIISNGKSIGIDGYNATYTPARIYGFANNSTQNIIVTVI